MADAASVRGLLLLGAFGIAACGDGLSQPDRPATSSVVVTFEPESAPDAVPSVVHIHVRGPVDLRTLGLFQGELSSYALGRIKSGEVPATLVERQVAAVGFRSTDDVVLAPSRPLELGEEYSLASAQGLISAFQVVKQSTGARLERVWPPPDGAGHFVYCSAEPSSPAPDTLELEPGNIAVAVSPGVDASGTLAERCISFDAGPELDPSAVVVPPVSYGGLALDPMPISAPDAAAAAAVSCANSELALGFGCATADDDRLLVRTPKAPLLWRVTTRAGGEVQLTSSEAPLLIRGLSPSASEPVAGEAYDALGNVESFSIVANTLPARDHLVLSEVLANPLGPEPASEWVEVVNDGSSALSLAGFVFEDSKIAVPLPAAELVPGEYALLVRDDFTPGGSDVAPLAGTQLVRLPELGSGGLSNSGEAVFLATSAGVVISSFPPLAPRAGDSAARAYPWSPDGAASSFTTGTPTPGAPNSGP